jgi:hypothetical protein
MDFSNFPISGAFKALFALAVVGVLALLGGSVWAIVWLI